MDNFISKAKNKLFILLLVLSSMTSLAAHAQETINVTGKITGKDDGIPLPGVVVKIKGSGAGTASDAHGNYSLKGVSPNATLECSYLGFVTTDEPVNRRTVIDFHLATDSRSLNEVVVIGYGTVKRKDLTGAVATIKGSDIKTQGVSDLTRSLQGKLPGVSIESAGGDPGAGTRILIRGVGTLGNANPLYIVDGVQVANINNLSATDIDSFDVLKDASAAAIYGSRAANGVVIVTTKSGKSGKPVIQFNANVGAQKIEHQVDVLNAEQWANVSNAAHVAAGLPSLDIAKNPSSLGAGTDWQNAIYRTAPVQQYEMLIGGGNESTKYSVSGSYMDQQGIVKKTDYNRYNLRIKSETTKGILKVGETVLLSQESRDLMPGGWGGQGGNPVGAAAVMIPAFSIYDPTAVGGYGGAYGPVVNVANPVAQLNLEDINRKQTSILTDVYGELTLLPGLTYKLNIGYTDNRSNYQDYAMRYTVGTLFTHPTNDLSQSRDQTNLLLLENTLNYNRQFGKSSLQALAGYTYQKNTYTYLQAARTDLPDGIINLDAGAGTSSNSGNSTDSRLVSVLARAIYSYDNRYVLTASFRRDGSSRFGSNNRYGNFPSIALGWNLSNESYLRSLFSKSFNSLKLRASYGILGNQEIGDYQYSAAVASNINYVTGTDQHKWFGAIQTAFASPNIKWENTKTANVGLDAGFFDNRLTITADYFIKTTSDVLLNVPIPGSAGAVSNPVVNAGTLRNQGIEVGANFSNRIGKFNYNIFGTISSIRNKVIALGTGSQQIFGGNPTLHGASTTVTQAGHPISDFYLVKAIGIFNSQDEVNNYSKNGKLIQPNAAPGDIKFLDANGDGQINDQDKVDLGSPFPKLEYGLGLNASYGDFDINLFFQGVYGNKIYNGLRQDLESMSLEFNYSAATLNAWTPANHSTIPRAVINDPNFNDRTSSRFLESGSYLRMKTLQVGYKFSSPFMKRINVSSLRAYFSADNIFTHTNYTGLNPDIGRTGSILDRGVDYGFSAYPLARTFSLGLQLTL
ncbi:TonB-dependent receptor [Mucilaginibacter sp. SMC90]|uniref:SusC/RagA family TonB-linked outer membrane protein n=1 Tax=Mucilaginibacter sp. SMC90 TaxID=2929803 RepID=UPI001FB21402|nr:TonB-dependent receptor [Mucilaginibacter sp. SMC90]UOE47769.1 TonB-dependent receptor [Mucilaginibacter sp. SMC90]